MSAERRYRRLLRWYPVAWQKAHGEVFLGTALDVADAESRTRPALAEAWSVRLSGLGERLDARASLVFSASTLVAALAGYALIFTRTDTLTASTLTWFLAPFLATVAVVALLRSARVLSPIGAVVTVLLAAPAWGLACLTGLSWSVGFDEADAGMARSAFSLSLAWLLFAGWIVGGIAAWVAVHSATRSLPRAARVAVAAVGAFFLPPVLGLGVISPLPTALVALICLVLAVRQLAIPRPAEPAATLARGPIPRSARRAAGIIAVSSTVLGICAVAFAFTGSNWVPAIDSTRAMQWGIAAGLLCIVPLVLALGELLGIRYPHMRTLVRAAGIVFSASLVIAAVPALAYDTRATEPNWLASAVGGIAVALLVFAIARTASRSAAVGIAVATGLFYAVFLGWVLPLVLPFIVPLAAIGVAVWGLRAAQERQPRRTLRVVQPD